MSCPENTPFRCQKTKRQKNLFASLEAMYPKPGSISRELWKERLLNVYADYSIAMGIRRPQNPNPIKRKFVDSPIGKLRITPEGYTRNIEVHPIKRRVELTIVDEALISNPEVFQVLRRVQSRAKTLRNELQSFLARHYRELRQLRESGQIEDCFKMPRLKRTSDIWIQISNPSIVMRNLNKLEIRMSWTPKWDPEHGLYVALNNRGQIMELVDG